jgi:hypothetical protein
MRPVLPVLILFCVPALAQESQFEKYQKMTAEGSPVELFELTGEELWKKPQGPKNASLRSAIWARDPACSRARTRRCRATSRTPTG